MGSAPAHEASLEISAQHGQCHIAKARKQQCLCIMEGLTEGGIHGLFDEAARASRPVPHGEQRGGAERRIGVAQRDR